MISERKVKTLCNKFKFTYNYFDHNNVIIIISRYDKWRVSLPNRGKPILHHYNKLDMDNYHFQKKFPQHCSLEEVLEYIENHDNYVINGDAHTNNIFKLLDEVRRK